MFSFLKKKQNIAYFRFAILFPILPRRIKIQMFYLTKDMPNF